MPNLFRKKQYLNENMSESELKSQLRIRVQEIRNLPQNKKDENMRMIAPFYNDANRALKSTDPMRLQLIKQLILHCDKDIIKFDVRRDMATRLGELTRKLEVSYGMSYDTGTHKASQSPGSKKKLPKSALEKLEALHNLTQQFAGKAALTDYSPLMANELRLTLTNFRSQMYPTQSKQFFGFIKSKSNDKFDKLINAELDALFKMVDKISLKEPKKGLTEKSANKLSR